MNKSSWTFLSNHGRVLIYLAKNSNTTAQIIAQDTGLSVRAIQSMIDDLEKEGYIVKEKIGRCNRYTVCADMPMRHRLERRHNVGRLLTALGCERPIVRLEKV